MPRRPEPSIADVIRFIQSRVSHQDSVFRKNPFVGQRFHYRLVRRALAELHRAGRYLALEAFDIKGTLYLWKGPGGVNYTLARDATKRLISSLQARLPGITLERILPEINLRCFTHVPIDNYGTTLGGMLANVYGNSPYQALKDLIDHDGDFSSFRDFQPSDMRKAPQETWKQKGGKRDYRRARDLTRRCLELIIHRHPDLTMDTLLSKVETAELMGTALNKYGTTLGGMLDQVYGRSPYLALRDLAEHDPRYREYLPAIRRRRYRSRKPKASRRTVVPRATLRGIRLG